jgi:hypothetical protein
MIARLRELQKVGVGLVLASDPSGDLEALRIFATQVMPALRGPATSAQPCEVAAAA